MTKLTRLVVEWNDKDGILLPTLLVEGLKINLEPVYTKKYDNYERQEFDVGLYGIANNGCE